MEILDPRNIDDFLWVWLGVVGRVRESCGVVWCGLARLGEVE